MESSPASPAFTPHAAAAAEPMNSLRRADWALRAAVLLFAVGLARALFTRAGSSIGSVALLEWDVSHGHILLGEKLVAALVLLGAVSLLIRPTVPVLAAIAAILFAESCAAVRAGGFHFFELTPYANALRYLTPLALIPLLAPAAGHLPPLRLQSAKWILQLGLATVFATHGFEAWQLHPQFIDFIIGTGRTLGGFAITETNAASALKAIAVMDFAVAALLLLRPSPALLAWMAVWGLTTALARPLSLGFASYPEVLLRAPHFIAPFAIGQLGAILATRSRPCPSTAPSSGAAPSPPL
jgi:hypothetical protein